MLACLFFYSAYARLVLVELSYKQRLDRRSKHTHVHSVVGLLTLAVALGYVLDRQQSFVKLAGLVFGRDNLELGDFFLGHTNT